MIEFNARFGDPETQVVLARLQTPLGGLLRASATGELDRVGPLMWSEQHAVTVVVASHNYPDTPRTGDPVTGDSNRGESVPGHRLIRPQPGVPPARTGSGSFRRRRSTMTTVCAI